MPKDNTTEVNPESSPRDLDLNIINHIKDRNIPTPAPTQEDMNPKTGLPFVWIREDKVLEDLSSQRAEVVGKIRSEVEIMIANFSVPARQGGYRTSVSNPANFALSKVLSLLDNELK